MEPGNGYHLYWYGNPNTLELGPETYLENPAGGGPFSVSLSDWEPNNRVLFERWDDFWADYDHWHNSQFAEMEILTVADPGARFALLKGGQADSVYNLPWALAKDLPKSEDLGIRGVNPRKWRHLDSDLPSQRNVDHDLRLPPSSSCGCETCRQGR